MRRVIALLIFAGMLPLSTFAQESIDYSYVDGVIASREGPGDDFEGVGLRGSMPISPQIFLAADIYALNVNEIDRIDLSIGAGYHMPLNRTTDFVGQLDWVTIDNDIGDDDGLRVGAGVRSLLAKQLEVRGMLYYADVSDGDLVLELGAQYTWTPGWAGFIEVSDGGEFGGTTVGVRFDY